MLNERLISVDEGTFIERGSSGLALLPKLSNAEMQLRDCIIASGSPTSIRESCALSILGSEAMHVEVAFGIYAFSLLAKGTIDAVVECNILPQVLMSVAPLLRGVGAVITDWTGRETCTSRHIVAARSKSLATKIAATLSRPWLKHEH